MAVIELARQRPGFNSRIYTGPGLFQASDKTVRVSGSPALMCHLLFTVCHRWKDLALALLLNVRQRVGANRKDT